MNRDQTANSVRVFLKSAGAEKAAVPEPPPPPADGWRAVFYPEILGAFTRGYWRGGLVKDLLAGVIVGIVALPLAIAFAVASGVPPDKGLLTAIVAGFVISLLGGSRVQIGGPTGAFIVIVLGIVEKHGLAGLMVSTMMAGAMLIAFGLFRLGNVIKYIPHPVIVGFTSGIAVTIFTTQVKDGLGLALAEVPGSFHGKWGAFLAHPELVNPWAAGMTAATIVVIVAGRKIKGLGKVPGSLVAILAAAAATHFLKLPVATIGGDLGDFSLTFAPALPAVDWTKLGDYAQPAFTIAVLGAVESLLSAVVADGMTGGRHNSNTELIGQGVANLVTPFFGGIPATGAIARTATNIKSGGRTPVAGLVHALVLLAIGLALGKYARMIPLPCLAGILMVVAYNMSEWRSFAAIMRASASEVAVLLTTFFLTVLVDLTVAIEIGMVLAAFLFLQRMANMGAVFNHADGAAVSGRARAAATEDYSALPAGLDVFEISGPFFFAAARRYQEVLQNLGSGSKVVIIRMRHVPFVDMTGMRNFHDAIAFMQAAGRVVLLSGVREAVLGDLKRHGVAELVGNQNIFRTFGDATDHARRLLLPPPAEAMGNE